jgi:REP element-mobilizing transposase RayT
MARPLRLEIEGGVYHITNRGNARQLIFLDGGDKQKFLETLNSVVERFNWLRHAYCLMDNHYHLMVETPDGNISGGMRQLNGVYTQSFNKRYKSVGHLFQGRYKSILVDKDRYLLSLCRYVVLNPVRAKLVKSPNAWQWSSYKATIGKAKKPPFLTADWILSQFGDNKADAIADYKKFVLGGKSEDSPWRDVKGQIFLGVEVLIEKYRKLLKEKEDLKEIPRIQRYSLRPTLDKLLLESKYENKKIKDKIIYEAYVRYGYTLKEIAEYLGVHYVTISRTIKRVEVK